MKLARNNPDLLDQRDPELIRRASAVFQRTIWPYHRAEVRGLDRIPKKHGVIYVGNHNGYPYMTEFYILTSALFQQFGMGRYPYILGHDFSLSLPLLNQFLTGYGCVRANRDNARRVLELDEPLLVYPGGDEELMRPHRDRARLKFQGRVGYVRLALTHNKPIVPVVAVGGHSTALILDDLRWLAEAVGAKRKLRVSAWPLMLSIPWGLTLGPVIPPYLPWPSKIIVEVLEPVVFPSASSVGVDEKIWTQTCARRLERILEDALLRLEAERVSEHGLRYLGQRGAQSLRRWAARLRPQDATSVEERREHVAPPEAAAGTFDRVLAAIHSRL
jgi:1-acyl-sn-glycerol-3-phosphate acyltransferase